MADEMKSQTCCFTGHRVIPRGDYSRIKKETRAAVRALIGEGVLYFGAGGALGFDTMAAEVVLEEKAAFPEIKLILILPCRDQANHWSSANLARYQSIMSQADKVVYTAEHYHAGCMQKRNRHLVDCSSHCIAYLTASTGGTAYTVAYAEQAGLSVHRIK